MRMRRNTQITVPQECISEYGIYTVAQVARILQRSEDAIREDIRRGRIPAVKLEREYRIGGKALLEMFCGDAKLYTQAELDAAVERAKEETRAAIHAQLYALVRDAGSR